jgi:predicted O-methyltransferase YrrM
MMGRIKAAPRGRESLKLGGARLLKLIIRGQDFAFRRTRFDDEAGNRADLHRILSSTPRALVSMSLRRWLGYRPAVPWIPYQATELIGRLIQSDWKVIEFGSGMSTIWLASRCAFMRSVESNADWYDRVSAMLRTRHLDHVRYVLRTGGDYSDLSEYGVGFFDFALIDGRYREDCVTSTLAKLRPGGWIYLDNTDRMDYWPARDALLSAVEERKGSVQIIRDFSPTSFVVTQGMLARL